MSQRIADRGYIKHDEEVGFFTSLLIDLKLREMGREPRQPITLERLDQATKHVRTVMQCRKQGLYK